MLRRSTTCLHRVSLIASLRNGELMIEECGAHAGSKPQESRTRQDLVAQMLWAGFVALSFVTMSKPRENLDTDTSADINIPLRATSPRLPAQTRFSFASAQMTPLSIDGPGRFC
jgi:hypothetical protein